MQCNLQLELEPSKWISAAGAANAARLASSCSEALPCSAIDFSTAIARSARDMQGGASSLPCLHCSAPVCPRQSYIISQETHRHKQRVAKLAKKLDNINTY